MKCEAQPKQSMDVLMADRNISQLAATSCLIKEINVAYLHLTSLHQTVHEKIIKQTVDTGTCENDVESGSTMTRGGPQGRTEDQQ